LYPRVFLGRGQEAINKSGYFAGYSGRGGAVKIRDSVVREFADDSGISMKALAEMILKE
jgi:hypothetical protein